ncbi:MAG: excinuclease ABC subunit UvrC [Pseudomonadales bacterium]|jgi:excinuclease ABC subunit C|nr:excinuclease ABC subunit UvrC [Pseudomonadales bacterium]
MSEEHFDHDTFLKHASARPGVYRMLDGNGDTLYVGKAKNLKKRLSNYFRGSGLDNKTLALVNKIHSIETTLTHSETEALLLEQNLIKDTRPPYNIMLRDDKSYPYIFLSSKDTYPRFALHRGAQKASGTYFGPFPSATAVRESLAILQKVFRVRQCEDSYFRNRTRPCLQYQIKRCSGPCVNLTTPEAYAEDVRHSVLFIEGRNEQVTEELAERMETLATALRFEEAATLRDQVKDLRLIQERQYVAGEKGDVDVLALSEAAGIVCVHLMLIRGGRLLGSRNFYPRFSLEDTPQAQLHAFIARYYLIEQNQFSQPRELICSHEPLECAELEAAFGVVAKHKVAVTSRVRGHRLKWLELAQTNASHGVESKLNSKQQVLKRFNHLGAALKLDQPLLRLECFDISHSQGEATVASCVVFDQNGPLKSDYRRFNIDGIQGGDDYAAMNQALKRRFTRLQKGEGKLPDLLVIDGGKGQLAQAEAIMQELQVENVLLLGIAKGISRRAGQETLILGGSHRELVLPMESPALHLLQHIRDEAHRFAITAHRQRRGKARTRSALDDIPGVGPKKRRDLLRHFGGQQEIRRASIDDLQRVNGISKTLAETIYEHLHR